MQDSGIDASGESVDFLPTICHFFSGSASSDCHSLGFVGGMYMLLKKALPFYEIRPSDFLGQF
jgi:hypothetical protein